jgi:hypothetical protein
MKTTWGVILANIFLCSILLGQSCPLPFSHDHSGRICFGYAMSRVGNLSLSCNPETAYSGSIDGAYFDQYAWSLRDSLLAVGDIVTWSTHAAYVYNLRRVADTVVVDEIILDHTARSKDTVWSHDPMPTARRRLGSDLGYPSTFWKPKKVQVTVRNSFYGGTVCVDGRTDTSGSLFLVPWCDDASFQAGNQNFQDVYRMWTHWDMNIVNNPCLLRGKAGDSHIAHFNSYCDMNFSNSMPGSSGGKMKIWDTVRTAPATVRFELNSPSTFHAIAMDTMMNSISYTFTGWSDNEPSRDRVISTSHHGSFTAQFSAKPNAPTNLQQVAAIGQYVHLTWTDNPNTAVNVCRIYRHQVGYQRSLVATIGRGGSWTDPDITVVNPKDGVEYIYEVCSYFSGAIESDYVSVNQFGEQAVRLDASLAPGEGINGVPTEFSIGSHPNPFNPSTTISYALPENSSVRLEIVDMAGRRVMSLIDDTRPAGSHSVVWNGRNSNGAPLASGIYLYRFTAAPISGSKPFTESGKLVLVK